MIVTKMMRNLENALMKLLKAASNPLKLLAARQKVGSWRWLNLITFNLRELSGS